MSTDYNYSRYTPLDSTGLDYDVLKSAYKNLRFSLATTRKHSVTSADMANLPGIAHVYYGDVSLWRAIMTFNGLDDAIQDVYPGMQLNLFDKSALIDFISKQQKNTQLTLTI